MFHTRDSCNTIRRQEDSGHLYYRTFFFLLRRLLQILYCGVARDLFQTSKGTYLAWRQTWILGFPGVDSQRGQKETEKKEKKKEELCGTHSCVTSVTSLPAARVFAIVNQFLTWKVPLVFRHVTVFSFCNFSFSKFFYRRQYWIHLYNVSRLSEVSLYSMVPRKEFFVTLQLMRVFEYLPLQC